MPNYAVSLRADDKYSPIFMFEGEDEVTVIEEFKIFQDLMHENGVEDILYLSKVPDDDADAVEEIMNRNLQKSQKLTDIVLVYLELPDRFNPEWN